MVTILAIIFFFSLLMLLVPYVIFPLTIKVASTVGGRKVEKQAFVPGVCMIVSAYNEEMNIGKRIDNFLRVDYQREKVQLVVVSDASDDDTDKIVASFGDKRIKLLRQEQRKGKTPALNLAARTAQGSILVFTDSNTMFEKDSLRHLVAPFVSPEIGLVSGLQLYRSGEISADSSMDLYSKLEARLKQWEGRLGFICGADGAIYAMRRELYQELPVDYINDFFHPISVVRQGYKAIYEPQAVAWEEKAGDLGKEVQRQKRMTGQAAYIAVREIGSLLRQGHWLFSFSLFGHKISRWILTLWLVPLLLTNLLLFSSHWFFSLCLVAQIMFYMLVVAGYIGRGRMSGVPGFAYKVFVLHMAMTDGFFDALLGKVKITWEIQRKDGRV